MKDEELVSAGIPGFSIPETLPAITSYTTNGYMSYVIDTTGSLWFWEEDPWHGDPCHRTPQRVQALQDYKIKQVEIGELIISAWCLTVDGEVFNLSCGKVEKLDVEPISQIAVHRGKMFRSGKRLLHFVI